VLESLGFVEDMCCERFERRKVFARVVTAEEQFPT
jgi:hypothetical protein